MPSELDTWQGISADVQVPRILNPVVLVVDSLPDLCKDQQVKGYVESLFGSVEQCRYVIAKLALPSNPVLTLSNTCDVQEIHSC